MSTPQFIEWLDAKMREYEGKVIPPIEVIRDRYDDQLEDKLREKITERILRDADIDGQVNEAVSGIPDHGIDADEIKEWLDQNPDKLWSAWVDEDIDSIVADESIADDEGGQQ
jgi:hypothetical protein